MRRLIFTTLILMVGMVYQGVGQINVTLPDTSIDAGEFVLIPITVSDVTDSNYTSFQFDLNFDSSVVKPIEVSIENTISAPNGQLYYNLNNEGFLTAAVITDGTLVGSGELITILFEAVGAPEDSTMLNFTYFEFDAKTDVANMNDGKIKINSNFVKVDFSANVSDNVSIIVDDTLRSLPFSTRWLKDTQHTIDVPDPQDMGSGVQYLFQQWSDGKAKLHTVSSIVDTSFEVTFNTQYFLKLITSHGLTHGEGWYNSGATAYFSIDSLVSTSDNIRHKFISWTGAGENSYSGPDRESSVEMTNPITEEANWENEYLLKVISPYGSPFGQGWYEDGSTAEFGVDSTEILTKNEHFTFSSWSGVGEGSYNGNEPQHELVVNNPVVQQAEWKEEFFVRFDSNVENTIDTTGTGWYLKGDSLTTSIAPDSVVVDTIMYFFRSWQINDNLVYENPATVSVDSALVVKALYSKHIQVTITTTVGAGTKVLVDGSEKDAPFAVQWLSDYTHTIGVDLYQQFTSQTRYRFNSWLHGGERIQEVAPGENYAFIAKLDTQYCVVMATLPAELYEIEGSDWYNAGETIELPSIEKIIEKAGKFWRFKNWQTNGEDVDLEATSFLVDKPLLVTACYEEAFQITGVAIFGDKPLEGVEVTVTGDEIDTVLTASNGEYTIPPLFSGNYEIVPVKQGYRFEPEKLSFNPLNSTLADQNFAAFELSSNLDGENNQPEKFQVRQNYPNPFNSTTIIPFEVEENSTVTLTIFNVLGQPVKSLIRNNVLSGIQRIQWNGDDENGNVVPSGVYFYKLMIDDRVLTKKMILLE